MPGKKSADSGETNEGDWETALSPIPPMSGRGPGEVQMRKESGFRGGHKKSSAARGRTICLAQTPPPLPGFDGKK